MVEFFEELPDKRTGGKDRKGSLSTPEHVQQIISSDPKKDGD